MKNLLKNILLTFSILTLTVILVACGKSETNSVTSSLPQFQELEEGETIAIINTNKGQIKIRFFEEIAPLAVENFLTHAKDGYYDNLTFHRVIKDFVIQGGDPNGDGTGGESIWGEPFNDEISSYLRHFRGALSMANSGENTNGSQFFIVQNSQIDDSLKQDLEFFIENQESFIDENETIKIKDVFSKEVCETYISDGGTPSLDGMHTVFGQVYEGMDIVDSIANVETDENDKPLEDIIIENIEVTQYSK